ncbi:OLC1v1002870C1 [Oldenlandia corymbosa var. corymbosa]|uniref:OLC1v1002870C1 n=1 Tax=Oldenlandia corymbosa var. corymbosa TaxID=529605 RepID=A0AAV1D9I3_OLDCO|nr:OLC1v1002870C1 [Oldenlandia corymbosa var. corymbosa]
MNMSLLFDSSGNGSRRYATIKDEPSLEVLYFLSGSLYVDTEDITHSERARNPTSNTHGSGSRQMGTGASRSNVETRTGRDRSLFENPTNEDCMEDQSDPGYKDPVNEDYMYYSDLNDSDYTSGSGESEEGCEVSSESDDSGYESENFEKNELKLEKEKNYWLLKTEPGEWSWEDQAANGGVSKWDGVMNKQAQKNMKSMRVGDYCFFYHSGAKARRVVSVVAVIREWYGEDTDEGPAVNVKEVGEMRRYVDLAEMKKEAGLEGFGLLKQPRLSVVPVETGLWERVFEMGGGFEGDGGGAGQDDAC